MIILHAGLEDGRVLLWGETPPAAPAKSAPRGRKPKSPQPRPFPFDPGAQPLADAVADALPQTAKSPPAAEQRFLWLPSVQDRPVASSAPRRRAAGAGRGRSAGAVARDCPAP